MQGIALLMFDRVGISAQVLVCTIGKSDQSVYVVDYKVLDSKRL